MADPVDLLFAIYGLLDKALGVQDAVQDVVGLTLCQQATCEQCGGWEVQALTVHTEVRSPLPRHTSHSCFCIANWLL